jgi:hypothetical protein
MSTTAPTSQSNPTLALLERIAASLDRLVALAEHAPRRAQAAPGSTSSAPAHAAREVPCQRRPGGGRATEISSKYAGQCRQCGAEHVPGDRVVLTPGGKGALCLACFRARGAA